MKYIPRIGIAILLALGAPFQTSPAQDEPRTCHSLDQKTALMFVPDKVPLEAENIPVDARNLVALQFPNKERIAIALLITSVYSTDFREKYQYVFVSETRVRLDRWNLPAGMIGLGLEPASDRDLPTRTLVARDFLGQELERITLKLDTSSPAVLVSLTPQGEKEFELRMGRYVVRGAQR